MAAFPVAVSARYDARSGRIAIKLASGLNLSFLPSHVQGLEHARPDDLRQIRIAPSGLGLHFPRLDADLYIPGLLKGLFGSERWVAAEMGKLGGRVSSRAKAAAARANGRLGGRPRTAPQRAVSR